LGDNRIVAGSKAGMANVALRSRRFGFFTIHSTRVTHLTELRRLAAHAENRRTETGIPRVAMVQGSIPVKWLPSLGPVD